MDAERLIRLGRVEGVTASPDGTWLAVTLRELVEGKKTRFVSSLWRVPTDGSAAVRLTRGGFDARSPQFRHDGALGFLSPRPEDGTEPGEGETERAQVWLLPVEGGEPRRLTDQPLGVSAFRFASGGNAMALAAARLPGVAEDEQRKTAQERRKNGPSALHYRRSPVRYWDSWEPRAEPHIFVGDADGSSLTDLTPDPGDDYRRLEAGAFDLSPDGGTLALVRRRPGAHRLWDAGLDLVNVATRERRVVDDSPGRVVDRVRFSPDGNMLLKSTWNLVEGAAPRIKLFVVDVATSGERELAAALDRRPVGAQWTQARPDASQAIVFSADDEGDVAAFSVDVDTDDVTRLVAPGCGALWSLAPLPDGRVGAMSSTVLAPPEPCVLDDGEVRPLARLSGFDVAAKDIARVESFSVKGADDVRVDGYLLLPKGRAKKAPAIMFIHGGPIGQMGDSWHWRWNALTFVAQGYAVALPNARGSTGRGQAYIDDIWNNQWGGACFEDLLAVADHMERHEAIDPARIAIMGGSFGGYMTNWFGGKTADRFRCLVTHASLFDMSAFAGTTDFPAYWTTMMGGTPNDEAGEFDRYSPHRLLDDWQQPTLVIHGEQDYRVPIGEGLALFEGLLARGIDAELLAFPDENHWISKPRNIVAWHEHILEFLGRHLS